MQRVMTLMLALAFLGVLAIPAMAGVTVDGNLKTEVVFLDESDVGRGFHNVRGNVNVNSDVSEGVEALIELRTDGNAIRVRQTLIKLSDLHNLISNLLPNIPNIPNAVLRIGRLRLPFAAGLQTVDGANNMGNPLIDGSAEYNTIIARALRSNIDNGTDLTMNFSDMFSATLGIFTGPPPANDKGAYVLRGVAKPIQALTITGEYYTSDNTLDIPNAPTDKVSAFEIIGQYQAPIASMLTVKGIYGKVTNKRETIKPTISYMGVQGSYDINDMIWVACRLLKSTLDHDVAGRDDTETTEMAIGGGVNIASNTKVKAQYRSVKTEETDSSIKTEIVVAF